MAAIFVAQPFKDTISTHAASTRHAAIKCKLPSTARCKLSCPNHSRARLSQRLGINHPSRNILVQKSTRVRYDTNRNTNQNLPRSLLRLWRNRDKGSAGSGLNPFLFAPFPACMFVTELVARQVLVGVLLEEFERGVWTRKYLSSWFCVYTVTNIVPCQFLCPKKHTHEGSGMWSLMLHCIRQTLSFLSCDTPIV